MNDRIVILGIIAFIIGFFILKTDYSGFFINTNDNKAQVSIAFEKKENSNEVIKKADSILLFLQNAFKEINIIKAVSMPDSDKNLNPSKNLLIVYNAENDESVVLKDYYINNRPEFKSANILAVRYKIPTTCFDEECLEKTGEYIYKQAFKEKIRDPIITWINTHPEKNIRHVVLIRGIPSKLIHSFVEYDVWGSVQWAIARSPIDTKKCTIYNYLSYAQGIDIDTSSTKPNSICDLKPNNPSTIIGTSFFDRNVFPGTLALVTLLDMGSVEATKAYIDKLKKVYAHMTNPSVIISATNAGIAGDTYYFEDSKTRSIDSAASLRKEEVLSINPKAKVFYRSPNEEHFKEAINVLGYVTWGQNSDFGGQYMSNGSIKFKENSNWYLIDTLESYNGAWTAGDIAGEHFQGNFIKWFSKNAFGGNNYENTPVVAVTSVEEPLLIGKNNPFLFSCWDAGNLFIDCAWSSHRTVFFQAIGDPWVTK